MSLQKVACSVGLVRKVIMTNKEVWQIDPKNERILLALIRAMTSPVWVLFSRSIGQAMTPRNASPRRLAQMWALAVMSHRRFNIRGPSVARVPPARASAAQPTAPGPTSPRSNARAPSMARPSSMAGSTTAVFMMIPMAEPRTSCPATWRK